MIVDENDEPIYPSEPAKLPPRAPSLSRTYSSQGDQGNEDTCALHAISNIFVHNIVGLDIHLTDKCNDLLKTHIFFNMSIAEQQSAIKKCISSTDDKNIIMKIVMHIYIYCMIKNLVGGLNHGTPNTPIQSINFPNLIVDIQYCIMNNYVTEEFLKITSQFKPIYIQFMFLQLQKKSSDIIFVNIKFVSGFKYPDGTIKIEMNQNNVQNLKYFMSNNLYVGINARSLSNETNGHAIIATKTFTEKGEEGIIIKNSWGETSTNVAIFEKDFKDTLLPPDNSTHYKLFYGWCIYSNLKYKRTPSDTNFRVYDNLVYGEPVRPFVAYKGSTQPFSHYNKFASPFMRYNESVGKYVYDESPLLEIGHPSPYLTVPRRPLQSTGPQSRAFHAQPITEGQFDDAGGSKRKRKTKKYK